MITKIPFRPGSQKTQERLNKILDHFMETLVEDEAKIFGGENLRTGAYFAVLQRRRMAWTKSKQCLFPECTAQSIKHSHTIPRGSLEFLSDSKGELMTPLFDPKTGLMKFEAVHINTASTFAGYCATHEQIFSSFEKSKELRLAPDIFLQVFRTACRELRNREHYLKDQIEMLAEFKKRYSEWAHKFMGEKMELYFKNVGDLKLQGMKFGPIEERFKIQEDAIKKLELHINTLNLNFLNPMIDTFSSGKSDLALIHMLVTPRLPVALAGRGSFFHPPGDPDRKELDILINVFPEKDGSLLILSGNPVHKDAFTKYLESFYGLGRLGIILMIESWMLHGSDHWFIPTTVAKKFSTGQAQKILDHVATTNGNCRTIPDVSIFDDERRACLKDFEESLQEQRQSLSESSYLEYCQFIEKERKKLG